MRDIVDWVGRHAVLIVIGGLLCYVGLLVVAALGLNGYLSPVATYLGVAFLSLLLALSALGLLIAVLIVGGQSK